MIVGIGIQGLLVVCIWRVLAHTKLGPFLELVFFAEAVFIQLAAPYLACRHLDIGLGALATADARCLSQRSRWRIFLRALVESQIGLYWFIGAVTVALLLYIPSVSDLSPLQVAFLQVVCVTYVFVGASIGAFFWRLTHHQLFATELAYLGWAILTGGVFLLAPLQRYVEDLEPIIPAVLRLNPLIAVCHLLKLDIFRTPYLYELTPVASYLYVFPPWYAICGLQILIGALFLILSLYHV